MAADRTSPSARALQAVLDVAGPGATLAAVTPLAGGQHAATWRVDTDAPARSVVVREFPAGDPAAQREQAALRALHGLGGRVPTPLGAPADTPRPTSLISWLDGHADITPADPERWAQELSCALAVVHAVALDGLTLLPSAFERGGPERLDGPLATVVRSRWAELAAATPVLTHTDFWSGNVVWRDGRLTGIVDWPGASLGPRAYDVGWCRLDLVLLQDEAIADVFLAAYEVAAGVTVDRWLADAWSAARSHAWVATWAPNYEPLGRPDLDAAALARRHAAWTAQLARGPA